MNFDALAYETPTLGTHYWVLDSVLDQPIPVAERCWAKRAWVMGAPYLPEPWPGMRAGEALTPPELTNLTEKVRALVGATELFHETSKTGGALSHNCVQIVGGGESVARPHVDSRELCTYAGVLFLHPYPPTKHSGTSFFRLKKPDGSLGGNICPPPFTHLNEALGVDKMPVTAWEEEVEVTNVFNRLVIYRAELVHSATAYFGQHHLQKRMTATFFWKAR